MTFDLNLTQWVVIAAIVVLIVYDTLVGKLKQPTESMVIRDWGWKYSTFAFSAGFLLGHWFFPRKSVDFTAWGFALPILAGLFVFDLVWIYQCKGKRTWFRWPGWYAFLGIFAGMYLWGQRSGESPF